MKWFKKTKTYNRHNEKKINKYIPIFKNKTITKTIINTPMNPIILMTIIQNNNNNNNNNIITIMIIIMTMITMIITIILMIIIIK